MEQYKPEIIEIFASLVDKINGENTENYKKQFVSAGGVTSARTVTLTEYLQFVIGAQFMGVQFYADHPIEILNQIAVKDRTELKFEKYPAICLFLDTTENHSGRFAYSTDSLQLIIANNTENTYTAKERHDKNFKPILLPIYYELMNQISLHKYINDSSDQRISHQKTNRYYWGRAGLYGVEGNIFNDFIDCIEIRNLNLNFNYLNC